MPNSPNAAITQIVRRRLPAENTSSNITSDASTASRISGSMARKLAVESELTGIFTRILLASHSRRLSQRLHDRRHARLNHGAHDAVEESDEQQCARQQRQRQFIPRRHVSDTWKALFV